MAYVKSPLGLFFRLLMITMRAQVALKKPLCINSNFVYKIAKIDTLNTQTIYSCKQYKKVTFSNFFYNNLPALQAQFNNIEVMLAQLGATNKFIIVIDDHNKNQTQVLANGVQIGSDLLTTGHSHPQSMSDSSAT